MATVLKGIKGQSHLTYNCIIHFYALLCTTSVAHACSNKLHCWQLFSQFRQQKFQLQVKFYEKYFFLLLNWVTLSKSWYFRLPNHHVSTSNMYFHFHHNFCLSQECISHILYSIIRGKEDLLCSSKLLSASLTLQHVTTIRSLFSSWLFTCNLFNTDYPLPIVHLECTRWCRFTFLTHIARITNAVGRETTWATQLYRQRNPYMWLAAWQWCHFLPASYRK